MTIVGADTGGTFTDIVTDTGSMQKVLSTPRDPARALRNALHDVPAPAVLAHGTTVATNALLERRLGRVALVTDRGFADVIEIARQVRPALYDAFRDRPPALVPRELRFELDDDDPAATMARIPADVDAVAVCLLHADLDAAREQRAAAAARAAGFRAVCSSEVSPEFREYERTVTTVIDAGLGPVCHDYLLDLGDLAADVLVMTSAGGLITVHEAATRPASLLLSGPAGGVRAAAAVAGAIGYPDAVTFDMGGTSTDVCLVRGAVPEPAPQRVVGGYTVRQPALDIHTIGAGGGSIAAVDAGGALTVGPGSAGAEPGPVCYGRGGTEPTVTDADLVLGRIPSEGFGALATALHVDGARAAFARTGIDPAGVVAVVDAAMVGAVRAVTVQRGVDPRRVALVAFGGAGPLHACALADALGMPAVVVPPRAGVLSAVGLVTAPRQRELVRSWPDPASDVGLAAALDALATEAAALVGSTDDVMTSVDCRYAGQGHELTVASPAEFPAEHARRNGYSRPDAPVEIVALRARARGPAPCDALPAVERPALTGPVVHAEPDCTVWVPDGWRATPDAGGAWVLTRQ